MPPNIFEIHKWTTDPINIYKNASLTIPPYKSRKYEFPRNRYVLQPWQFVYLHRVVHHTKIRMHVNQVEFRNRNTGASDEKEQVIRDIHDIEPNLIPSICASCKRGLWTRWHSLTSHLFLYQQVEALCPGTKQLQQHLCFVIISNLWRGLNLTNSLHLLKLWPSVLWITHLSRLISLPLSDVVFTWSHLNCVSFPVTIIDNIRTNLRVPIFNCMSL